MIIDLTIDYDNNANDFTDPEIGRFRSILKRHATCSGVERARSRKVLVEYITFSPNSRLLINELILHCISMKSPDRLDVAIDVLSEVGDAIVNYAYDYLQRDIQQWVKLYPRAKFRPNDDYWYVLLRAVGRCDGNEDKRFQILSACQDEPTRGVAESVVEGLADLGTPKALALLRNYADTNRDAFIRRLASESLDT